jgi:ABC-2 type transport system ATP-binding protein
MTVAAFLEFIAAMHGMAKAKANARLAELVDRVDLTEVWNQRIDSLSKGFKRRVAIAQALVHDPAALILDEPTDGLDPIQKYEMRDLIRSIAPKKAIIISTHILEEVEAVCTRAIIIAKGRLLADATPAELLARAPSNGTLALALSTADPQGAIDILSKHPGVGHVDVVQRVNGVTRIAVRISKSRPATDEITSLLGRSNIAVTEFYMERAKLDDVFREITSHGAEN